MLVTINPSVGGVSTDEKTRFFNFMCALHSVATCAAGGTPTAVNPTNTSGTKNTSYNCITVISNTEAGGWTAGTSNNITAATAYNASAASLVVDLYASSGKSSAPYLRQTFGNFSYSFSGGSFVSYPQLQWYQGHTANNPASTTYNADTTFYNGSTSVLRPTGSWTSDPAQFPLNVTNSGDVIYLAVTANYLIIVTPGGMCYFGLRNQAGWEIARTDNPPWCAFAFQDCNSGFIATNSTHTDYNYAWMAGIAADGTQTAPTKRGSQNSYASGPHTVTGQGYSSSQYYPWNNVTTNIRPLFQLSYASASYGANPNSGYNWSPDAPITDPVTGLTVPPAWPIVYSAAWGNPALTCSGQIPGIYKGMSQSAAGLTYFANATEYVIGGTSYVPVKTGDRAGGSFTNYPDLFLLRKA